MARQVSEISFQIPSATYIDDLRINIEARHYLDLTLRLGDRVAEQMPQGQPCKQRGRVALAIETVKVFGF